MLVSYVAAHFHTPWVSKRIVTWKAIVLAHDLPCVLYQPHAMGSWSFMEWEGLRVWGSHMPKSAHNAPHTSHIPVHKEERTALHTHHSSHKQSCESNNMRTNVSVQSKELTRYSCSRETNSYALVCVFVISWVMRVKFLE